MAEVKSLKERVAECIGRAGLQLRMFNPVALELQKALADEDAAPAAIESMIAKDPALVGQVLRMANSSLYSGLAEITTVRQALLRLGVKQVARLAIAAAQHSLYGARNPALGGRLADLWRQAYASALGASWIAEKCGHRDSAEPAFLAGLLHDIGKLVILRALEEVATERADGAELPGTLVEEMLESLHCDSGYELMKRWNLPDRYCVVGRDHHKPDYDASHVLLVIVRLLDQVCAKLGIGRAAAPDLVPAASAEAQLLGLSELQLAELELALEDGLAGAPA
jgi:HD-like signal output (HDOD) protein